jgi:Fe-S-cluster-containing dehydrogenase component
MNRYELTIDEKACWGCLACEIACKQENQVPSGIKYLSVQEEGPKWPDGRPDMFYRIKICRHCDQPECAGVCPEEAITKSNEDGIVILDDKKCTGCGACLEACPFQAIAFDRSKGKAGKCHLCHHRVEKGLVPACADNVCLAHGIIFKVISGKEESTDR